MTALASNTMILVSKRLVLINSASSIISRIVNLSVLAWAYQYLIRHLQPDDFAIYPVIMSIMVFAPLFFSVSLGGVSRYIIDAYAKGRVDIARSLLSSSIPLLLVSIAAFSLFLLPLVLFVDLILNIPVTLVSESQYMLLILWFGFVFQMICSPFSLAYHVKQRYIELNTLTLCRETLKLLLMLILLYLYGPRVLFIVIATVVSDIIFSIIMVMRSGRFLPDLYYQWRLFSRSQARELMSFGLWTTIGQLGTIMYLNSGTIILNMYGTAIDVTAYFIGVTIFRQIEGLIFTATGPLYPAVTALHSLDQRHRLKSIALRIGRYSLWFCMLLAVPAMIYADSFIYIYIGDTYYIAAIVIVCLMLIFPFNQPTSLLPMISVAMARPKEFFLAAFLFQAFGLLLMLIFTRTFGWGAVGVAAALSAITIGSQLTYFWSLCLKLIQARLVVFLRSVVVIGLIPAAAGAMVWMVLKFSIPPDGWFALVLHFVVGAVVYLSTLILFCLNADERSLARRLLKRAGLAGGSEP